MNDTILILIGLALFAALTAGGVVVGHGGRHVADGDSGLVGRGARGEDVTGGGGNWTPQAKAGVGSLSATIVFVLGIVLFPQAWPDGPTAFTTLFLAVLTVLSSAGAPVFRDVMRIGMQVSAKSGERRWTSWNN